MAETGYKVYASALPSGRYRYPLYATDNTAYDIDEICISNLKTKGAPAVEASNLITQISGSNIPLARYLSRPGYESSSARWVTCLNNDTRTLLSDSSTAVDSFGTTIVWNPMLKGTFPQYCYSDSSYEFESPGSPFLNLTTPGRYWLLRVDPINGTSPEFFAEHFGGNVDITEPCLLFLKYDEDSASIMTYAIFYADSFIDHVVPTSLLVELQGGGGGGAGGIVSCKSKPPIVSSRTFGGGGSGGAYQLIALQFIVPDVKPDVDGIYCAFDITVGAGGEAGLAGIYSTGTITDSQKRQAKGGDGGNTEIRCVSASELANQISKGNKYPFPFDVSDWDEYRNYAIITYKDGGSGDCEIVAPGGWGGTATTGAKSSATTNIDGSGIVAHDIYSIPGTYGGSGDSGIYGTVGGLMYPQTAVYIYGQDNAHEHDSYLFTSAASNIYRANYITFPPRQSSHPSEHIGSELLLCTGGGGGSSRLGTGGRGGYIAFDELLGSIYRFSGASGGVGAGGGGGVAECITIAPFLSYATNGGAGGDGQVKFYY